MGRHKGYVPAGVIPATLLAFNEDFSIDEAETRRHLTQVAANARHLGDHRERPRLRGPCLHFRGAAAHPGAARRRRSATGCRSSTASMPTARSRRRGSPAWPRRKARRRSSSSRRTAWRRAGSCAPRWRSPISGRIADATDLPIILFQYPAATGLGYPFETLLRLIEEVPTIRAVKDWCADPMLHERHIRTLQGLPRPVTRADDAQRLADELARHGRERAPLRRRQRRRRPAGGAVRGRQGQGPRGGAGRQRPPLPAAAGLLRAAVPRHAQPHEGVPRAARPPASAPWCARRSSSCRRPRSRG